MLEPRNSFIASYEWLYFDSTLHPGKSMNL